MRAFILILCCLTSLHDLAQSGIEYFDVNWKPCDALTARFFRTKQETDSGTWINDHYIANKQLQMRVLFTDGSEKVKNGPAYYYHSNGMPSGVGYYKMNKREGVCVSYHSNGMMSDSAFFHDDKPVRLQLGWFRNGNMEDSISRLNDSLSVTVHWFDNGVPSSAGHYLNGKHHGKWQYFHKNGRLACLKTYDHGRYIDSAFYDESGALQEKGSSMEVPATFKGGMEGWREYLENKLYWPTGYHFAQGNMAVVEISLTISEEGQMKDVEVVTPFHPVFDKIALDVIKGAKGWKPARQDNRNVSYHFRQMVTFSEPDDE